MISSKSGSFFLAVFLWFSGSVCMADGSTIDKVYVPYVQPLEKELEYRVLFEHDNADGYRSRTLHKLGYGMSVSDRWFVEAYVMGEGLSGENIDIEGYEIEAKLQLTEQGELDVDWGLLLELEKETAQDIWEAKAGLLVVKDWSKISLVGNIFIIREWGGDINTELEFSNSLQFRYRLRAELEPGLEWYSSQDTSAVGPVVMGRLTIGAREKLFWHLGVMFGVGKETVDRSLQLQFEYEFL